MPRKGSTRRGTAPATVGQHLEHPRPGRPSFGMDTQDSAREDTSATTVRATFRGTLHVEGETVRVKLYPLLKPPGVSFRLVDRTHLKPVRQILQDPQTGELTDRGSAGHGYRTDGSLVRLTSRELAELRPEPSREIRVSAMLPAGRPPLSWFNVPYLLGPDGNSAEWSAFSAALAGSGRTGIASWVMRRTEYAGALWSHEGFPVLSTLYSEEQVLPLAPDAGPLPEPPAEQLELARRLVSMLAADFRPADIPDARPVVLRRLLARRREEEDATVPLAEALRRSLEGEAHA